MGYVSVCALPPVLFRISIAAISFSGFYIFSKKKKYRNYNSSILYFFTCLISCSSMYLEVSKLVSLTCVFFEPWGSPPLFACHHSMTMAKKKRWSGWFRGQRHLEMVTNGCRSRTHIEFVCVDATTPSVAIQTSTCSHSNNPIRPMRSCLEQKENDKEENAHSCLTN